MYSLKIIWEGRCRAALDVYTSMDPCSSQLDQNCIYNVSDTKFA